MFGISCLGKQMSKLVQWPIGPEVGLSFIFLANQKQERGLLIIAKKMELKTK